MWRRLTIVLISGFFVTMNVLLWRSEFAGAGRLGPPVPADLVWDKVLTSPDNSQLEIRHRGVKIGRARWAALVGEGPATALNLAEDLPPEGMVQNLAGYTLDFDGTLSFEDLTRLRFTFTLKLDPNQHWKELSLKISIKPYSWEIQAFAATEQVRLVIDDDEGRREHAYTFAELRRPEKIIKDLGGAGWAALLAGLGMPLPAANSPGPSAGFHWEAREDRLQVGQNEIRVYRLQTRLLDRYQAVFFVSRVGEILRVEFPDEVVMMNDALTNL